MDTQTNTQLNTLALMMVTMYNTRLKVDCPEPDERPTTARTRRLNIRLRIGNAMIAAGHRLKGVQHTHAGAG